MAARPRRRSRTVRASGPCTDRICDDIERSAVALGLNAGTRPNDGPQPGQAAGVGRIANRPGDVVAVRQRRDAGRHRRGGPAARSAGRVRLATRD